MTDSVSAPATPSSSGSSTATDADLAKAFSQAVASMAVGLVENNKPQIHDSDDD